VGVLALVTSCGSSSGNTQPNQAGGGTTVAVRDVSGDQVLVNSSGRTLYTSDQEKAAGKILCSSRGLPRDLDPVDGREGAATHRPVRRVAQHRVPSWMARPRSSSTVGRCIRSRSTTRAGDVKGENTKDSFAGINFTWHSAHHERRGCAELRPVEPRLWLLNGCRSGSGTFRAGP
jgi:hypothetical protein